MPLSSTVRTSGMPSESTVASDMAFGSRGSDFTASSNQACQSRKGSSAWVKSPLVNHVGASIGAVSDIAHKTLTLRAKPRLPKRPRYRYKGTRKARLWRLRATAIAMSLALGTATSGCSLSYKLDSFMGKDSEKTLTTQSVPGAPASSPGTDSVMPPEGDLAYAKQAAALVVTRADKGASVPWANPATGARGTVTT